MLLQALTIAKHLLRFGNWVQNVGDERLRVAFERGNVDREACFKSRSRFLALVHHPDVTEELDELVTTKSKLERFPALGKSDFLGGSGTLQQIGFQDVRWREVQPASVQDREDAPRGIGRGHRDHDEIAALKHELDELIAAAFIHSFEFSS